MSTKTVKIKVKYDGSEASKGTKKTAAEFEEVNKKTTLLSQGIEKTGKEFKRLSRATKISKESLKEKNETVKISRDKLKGLDSGLIKTTRSTKKLSDEQARLKHNLKITSRPEVPIKHLNKELQSKIYLLENAQKELRKLAITDGLTGVFNYRFFKDQLVKEVTRAKRHDKQISIIMMDIDYFKNYNDTHGHPAGDTILKTIAKILVKNIRNIVVHINYRLN